MVIRGCKRVAIELIRRIETTADSEILTRVAAYEMAFRMQASVPVLMDLKREPKETLASYGAEEAKIVDGVLA